MSVADSVAKKRTLFLLTYAAMPFCRQQRSVLQAVAQTTKRSALQHPTAHINSIQTVQISQEVKK